MPTITLTKQEWFDAAWEQAKSRQKSVDEHGACLYVGPSGERCFVGAALDEETAKEFNDLGSCYTLFYKKLIAVADLTGSGESFISRLQRVHDDYDPSDWELRLREFAERWDLTVPE